ncbi:hypothetical protein F5Y16DRAFT_395140 [Xylariaceae sp. FL0255]|nr:hypothetical protein F5Y16DRAFT_395140 [Xylariaceae sp. FL0255]
MSWPQNSRPSFLSDSPEPIPNFRFGLELEMPLKIKIEGKYANFYDTERSYKAMDFITNEIQKKGVAAYNAFEITEDNSWRWNEWAVGRDPSIVYKRERFEDIMPIEIRSPPLDFLNKENARRALRNVYEVVSPLMAKDIRLWKLCSTHVHFSLQGYGPEFPLDKMKYIAMAIIYYQESIGAMMPEMTHTRDRERKGGWKNFRLATKNLVQPNGETALKDIHEVCMSICAATSVYDLNNILNWDPDDYRRVTMGMSRKDTAWNLKGIKWTTIEFRQPPPSRSYQEALDWVIFVGNFAARAMQINPVRLELALSGQMTYSEVFAQENVDVDEISEIMSRERTWLDAQIKLRAVKTFIPIDHQFWERMKASKDGMESDLKKLN